MNEYEKLMYKKEQDKTMNKALGCLTIIGVVVFALIYTSIKGVFILPSVVKDVTSDCFSNGEPYPPINGMVDQGDGWVIVSANANNKKDGLEKLRKTYNKLSKKISTKKVSKIVVGVCEDSGLDWGLVKPYQEGSFLFISEIWVKDLKSVDWESIETYEEFIKKANVK